MSDLISRYLNQPAKRCSRCGSEAFRLTPAGALCCVVCSPGESVAVLVARIASSGSGKLEWQQWSESFDGRLPLPSQQETLAAATRGVQGGGSPFAGVAGFGAGAGGWAWDATGERVDPEQPAGGGAAAVIVGTSLEWFVSGSQFWLAGDIEIIGVITGWPRAAVYRRLTQAYFGWLCGRVENARAAGKLRGEDLDAAQSALADIAFAAFGLGIFGEWACDPGKFPRAAPTGYVGPQVRGAVRLVGWDDEFESKWERAKARDSQIQNERLERNDGSIGVGGFAGDGHGVGRTGRVDAGAGRGGGNGSGKQRGSGGGSDKRAEPAGRTLAGLG